MRSIRVIRVVAGLCLVSLLPLILPPADLLAGDRTEQAHAEWLQSMLRTEATEGFYEVLAKVSAEEFASQQEFLVVFVRAFEASRSGEQLAPMFTHISVSNHELILLLQGKLTGVGADVFTVPASLRAALTHIASSTARGNTSPLSRTFADGANEISFLSTEIITAHAETAAGWLTSRQPLGP